MDFRVEAAAADTEEEKKFRQEVREFLDRELTPEVIQESGVIYDRGPHLMGFSRRLGAKGWLVPHWPKEYGGLGCPSSYRRIVIEELSSRGVSGVDSSFSTQIVGPMLMLRGSEEQKREYLPKIAGGEIEFALGYTEPNAGTDLAALEMRAVPDGDDYIVNGQKVYGSYAHTSTHHWLAVRTDPNAEKHQGISILLVDLASPGVTIRPLYTMAGERTNEIFYDDVRVPRRNLVGRENEGWSLVREALAFERGMLGGSRGIIRRSVVDELVDYAKATERNGKLLAEDPVVRQSLAQLAIENSIRRLFGHRLAWLTGKGKGAMPEVEAAMAKVWGVELDQRIANVGMQLLGLYGQLEPGSKQAPLEGRIEHLYRFWVHLSYGAGSHELMRSMMANRGIGLPREPRL